MRLFPVMAFLLAIALGDLGLAQGASAEELPEYVHATAEGKFLAGRLQDLAGVLDKASTPRDRFPLVLAAHWWRRSPGDLPDASTQPASLDAKRLLWAFRGGFEPPYPGYGSGGAEEEPYPLLRALIDDRIRRETQGAQGLPEEGPLAAYLQRSEGDRPKNEAWDLRNGMEMMIRNYRGDADPADEFRRDRAARALHDRNRLLYLTSLAAFMVLSFVGLLIAGRSRS